MELADFWAEHLPKIGSRALATSQGQTNLFMEISNLVRVVPTTSQVWFVLEVCLTDSFST